MTGDARFRLHTGDAVELMRSLPSASIDLVNTDVAYESLEKHRAVGTTTRLKESDASSNEWFQIFKNERFPEFFEEAFRVLKKNTHLYFFCDGETARIAIPIAEAAGFTFWNEIVWVKTKNTNVSADTLERSDLKIGMGYHYRKTKELVLFFEKGKRKVNDLGVPDVLPFARVNNGYPTEKPIELHKVLVSQSTRPGEIVLDPFMGSGSAGSAALRLGRCFVGNDLKETAVALARQRLLGTGAKEDPDLVPPRGDEPEPPKKTRAKKPPTEQDRQAMADAGGTTVAELPMGAAEASRDVREAEEAEEALRRLKDADPPLAPLGGYGLVRPVHTPILLDAPAGPPGSVFKLDGMFPTGPLPGGPTDHLPKPDIVAPPRPATCHHGELRSACILCRARR
jgi:site-specific DNA-methyltransferase (adenine-specific)